MTRTQIQLPDELFEEAKKSCARRGMSFAEMARRGIEHMLRIYPASTGDEKAVWTPPTSSGRDIGWAGFSDDELKRIAQQTSVDRMFSGEELE